MKINPFIYTRPLRPEEFLDRQSEVNTILRRLLNAESSIIVGDPHTGKTSFLQYLRHVAERHEQFKNFVFSFVDAHTLGEQFTPSQFWRRALEPLQEQIENKLSFLSQAFQRTESNQFGNFVLEKLFVKLEEGGWTFVLLLDEFDALLNHQVLNSAEFWGGLRSLSSRLSGLILLAASRKTINQMDKITQPIIAGSSYFNTFAGMQMESLRMRMGLLSERWLVVIRT
ncbi:orc1/cdc6 family replication initiation protein [Candidatus Poribacteria bacterium]|nr:orc1/cdc6 family replication initiation protein [Candidatus Poribacteria bacterium]